MNMWDHFDVGTLTVMILTFVLFSAALFSKGFTHDLLLEAGVFLISVKLMIMIYRNGVTSLSIQNKLDEIRRCVVQRDRADWL